MLLSGLALVSVSPLKFSVPKAAHRFEAGKYSSPIFLTQVLILLCLLSSLFLILARKSQWLYRSCLDWLRVCVCVCVCVCSCVRLFATPMDVTCNLPVSSVHEIFQARILEWVTISSSRGSAKSRNRTLVSYISCIGRQIFLLLSHLGSLPGLA